MRASFFLVVPVLAVAAACSTSNNTTGSTNESTARAASPIINGTNDTTHTAVVAILSQPDAQGNGGLCSGTIVKVDPTTKIGWVLTAAHCVELPPAYVVQAEDYTDPKALTYQIVDWQADATYNPNAQCATNDFAVIRIAGVDASTPVIPIATSPDGVTTGTAVVMVGYGRTTPQSAGPEDPTIRHMTNQSVADLGSSFGCPSGKVLGYDQQTTGTCFGDSGGPDIASGKVVGVHSFVEGDCNVASASGRVSGDLTFINGQLAKAAPTEDCTLCDKIAQSGTQQCAVLLQACLSDKDCGGFYQCFQNCGATATCRTTCLAKFPKAEGPLTAAGACSCDRACKTECTGKFLCAGVPKCGYKFPAGDCTTCTESTCCQEALDCGADGTCYLCLKNGDKDPACATNASRKKLANCVATSCNTQCANTGLTKGADPGVGDDGGPGDPSGDPPPATTTTTTSGCAVAGSPGGGGGSAFGLAALVGLALVGIRRRRSR